VAGSTQDTGQRPHDHATRVLGHAAHHLDTHDSPFVFPNHPDTATPSASTPPRLAASRICWALARFGGAGTVALGSAVISYGHLRDVLEAWHYTSLAAAVGPLVLDGLMVVCGFALLAASHASPGDTHRTRHQHTPGTRG
jgi:hypothetical protein